MVTRSQLLKVFPGANAALVAAVVANWGVAEAAGITTTKRVANFFAQIGAETGGLKNISENLNYSVEALLSKFGRHRISEADAKRLGRKKGDRPLSVARQTAIANVLYGGAWGKKNLGNTEPNDGWDYRGGGCMQTTGRSGYRKMGFEDNPEALRTAATAFLTAVREWTARGCNARADRGDVKGNRVAINGGTNGLDEANGYYAKGLKVFAEPQAPGLVSLMQQPSVFEAGAKDVSAEPITDKRTIEYVQERLRELGYNEVGNVDGNVGTFAAGAIRIFRADNGLPAGDQVDGDLLVALGKAEPRKLSPARANATPAEVRAVAPEVRANWLTKIVAGVTAIPAALVSFASGVLDKFAEAKDFIAPVKDVLGDVPPWAWAGVVAAVAGGIWYAARKGEAAGVEAVQTGARR